MKMIEKIIGIKKKKYLLSLILMAALCSPYSCAEENTFTASLKDTDLKSFIEIVGANLNKTIVMGPDVRGKVRFPYVSWLLFYSK